MNTAREKHNPEWFEWYDAAVFGLAVIVLCFTFAVRIVTVDGHSMEPTLLSGQRVAVQSAFYRPQYGDVVVVDSYSRYGDMLVKRVWCTAMARRWRSPMYWALLRFLMISGSPLRCRRAACFCWATTATARRTAVPAR